MLKKFGYVAVGVTAGLVAVAPLASAEEHGSSSGSGHTSCSSESDSRGNSGQSGECNVYNQHSGEGNTFNGVPIPDLLP